MTNQSHKVEAYLCAKNASAAIEFYKAAFDAKETDMRVEQEDGRIGHAEFTIGATLIMISDEFPEMGFLSPETIGGTPFSLFVYVDDADKTYAKALKLGATSLREPEDQFFGMRMATVSDPFGHRWMIGHHIEDVSAAEVKERAKKEEI